MSKKTDNQKAEAKAEDKAITVAEETPMTKADYFEALKLVGVTPPAKTLKDELEKLYKENLPQIELMTRLPDLKKACLIKSFGDQGTSGICPKCEKKQEDVYKDCGVYKDIVGALKTASTKKRKMGHRTGTALWGTRKGKYNNKFCEALLKAGEEGLTMAEVRKAKWNPAGHTFNETLDRLIEEGIAERDTEGRFKVTQKGIEESGRKKAA